ncbi:unnamed protein product, partial [Rhizoctonia solani]
PKLKAHGGSKRQGDAFNSFLVPDHSMVHSTLSPKLSLYILARLARTCAVVNAPSTPFRVKQCCFCSRTVNLGPGESDRSLIEHMQGNKCRQKQGSAYAQENDTTTTQEQFLIRAGYGSNESSINNMPNMYSGGGELCHGVYIDYGSSMFSHYPWQMHDPALGGQSYLLQNCPRTWITM